MILIHHVSYTTQSNPFRSSLKSFHDLTYIGGTSSLSFQRDHPAIEFPDLYNRLAKSMQDERGTIMLYTFIQHVHPFRDYALVRSDLETLLLPILQQVYDVPTSSQSQIYLLSIILLILSQDASFNRDVHKRIISGPDWYKERPLGVLSLGSFMIILLLRMAQSNLVSSRDPYLHTNIMAALANLMTTAVDLNSVSAQKFLSLIDLLHRTYLKTALSANAPKDAESKLQFYGDFLKFMLEMLDATISSKPVNNPNLVYASLQRYSLFETISSQSQEYAELTYNIRVLFCSYSL